MQGKAFKNEIIKFISYSIAPRWYLQNIFARENFPPFTLQITLFIINISCFTNVRPGNKNFSSHSFAVK